jgi:hypothetical protein
LPEQNSVRRASHALISIEDLLDPKWPAVDLGYGCFVANVDPHVVAILELVADSACLAHVLQAVRDDAFGRHLSAEDVVV